MENRIVFAMENRCPDIGQFLKYTNQLDSVWYGKQELRASHTYTSTTFSLVAIRPFVQKQT